MFLTMTYIVWGVSVCLAVCLSVQLIARVVSPVIITDCAGRDR